MYYFTLWSSKSFLFSSPLFNSINEIFILAIVLFSYKMSVRFFTETVYLLMFFRVFCLCQMFIMAHRNIFMRVILKLLS